MAFESKSEITELNRQQEDFPQEVYKAFAIEEVKATELPPADIRDCNSTEDLNSMSPLKTLSACSPMESTSKFLTKDENYIGVPSIWQLLKNALEEVEEV